MDPNKHQAMLEIEDAEKEQGTIVQEIQKGFTLKGRLLRPSLVGVSKKPQKNEIKTTKKGEKLILVITCRLGINTYMTIII